MDMNDIYAPLRKRRAKMLEMRENGKTLQEIADKFGGISRQAVDRQIFKAKRDRNIKNLKAK